MPPINRFKNETLRDFGKRKSALGNPMRKSKISSYVGITQIRSRVKAFAYSQPVYTSSPVSFNLLYYLYFFPSRTDCLLQEKFHFLSPEMRNVPSCETTEEIEEKVFSHSTWRLRSNGSSKSSCIHALGNSIDATDSF